MRPVIIIIIVIVIPPFLHRQHPKAEIIWE